MNKVSKGRVSPSHRELMDSNYRWMKYVYDMTRPAFLLGRNRLLRRIAMDNPRSVLEIGMGTGRNLKRLAPLAPDAKLLGADISREMLAYAQSSIRRAGLSDRIGTIEADGVPPAEALPGVGTFDAIFFSYSLSMIPDWQTALRDASKLVDPERGRLLILDFGRFNRWPGPLARQIHRNMNFFHATARHGIGDFLINEPVFRNWTIESHNYGGDWAVLYVLSPPMKPAVLAGRPAFEASTR